MNGPIAQPVIPAALPLLAVAGLASSFWDVPGSARLTNGDAGLKALEPWRGTDTAQWGPGLLPRLDLSFMSSEAASSCRTPASSAPSDDLTWKALLPAYFLKGVPGVHLGKVFLDFLREGDSTWCTAGSSSESI